MVSVNKYSMGFWISIILLNQFCSEVMLCDIQFCFKCDSIIRNERGEVFSESKRSPLPTIAWPFLQLQIAIRFRKPCYEFLALWPQVRWAK